MNINHKNLINEYRNYLIMLKVNTTKVNMSIKSIDDIKIYEEECKLNLNKLETLSKDHKLYEKDYDDWLRRYGRCHTFRMPFQRPLDERRSIR